MSPLGPEKLISLSVITLIAWTFLVLIVTEIARVIAMQRQGLNLQHFERGANATQMLPRWAVNIGDNYNHLLEAPTAFYAVSLLAVASGLASAWLASLAWTFVVLRILHTVVQCTVNRVLIRFPLFLASWLAVVAMMLALVPAIYS